MVSLANTLLVIKVEGGGVLPGNFIKLGAADERLFFHRELPLSEKSLPILSHMKRKVNGEKKRGRKRKIFKSGGEKCAK